MQLYHAKLATFVTVSKHAILHCLICQVCHCIIQLYTAKLAKFVTYLDRQFNTAKLAELVTVT